MKMKNIESIQRGEINEILNTSPGTKIIYHRGVVGSLPFDISSKANTLIDLGKITVVHSLHMHGGSEPSIYNWIAVKLRESN